MKRRGVQAWLAAGLFGVATAMAAPLQQMQPGQRPEPGSTEAELWYALERSERELQGVPQLIRDEALNAYVRGVVCKVVAPFCDDVRVYVLEVPVFNASMAPNGMMLIFSGALLRMQDEAELALVVGHELGHYRARHSLQQWEKTKNTAAAFGVVGMAGMGGLGASLAALAVQTAGLAGLAQYSRDHEREADDLGFDVLVSTGYDAAAGERVWGRMQREEKAWKGSKGWSVFASHPKTSERLEDLAIAAAAHAGEPGETNQAAYRAAMRPFLQRWLDDELSRRFFDTSIEVIGDLRAHAEDADKAVYDFYLGEAHRRRNRPGDRERAYSLFADAVRQPGVPAAAWREHGFALREAGARADAAAAMRRYLELAPVATDRAFIEPIIAELEKTP